MGKPIIIKYNTEAHSIYISTKLNLCVFMKFQKQQLQFNGHFSSYSKGNFVVRYVIHA